MFKKNYEILCYQLHGVLHYQFIFKDSTENAPTGSWAIFIIKGVVFVGTFFLITWQEGGFKEPDTKDKNKD